MFDAVVSLVGEGRISIPSRYLILQTAPESAKEPHMSILRQKKRLS